MKTIDFSKSVYDLSRQYPDFVPIMVELGFEHMSNPATLQTMGRMINVLEGAKRHNIPLETITKKFEEHGFHVVEFNQ